LTNRSEGVEPTPRRSPRRSVCAEQTQSWARRHRAEQTQRSYASDRTNPILRPSGPAPTEPNRRPSERPSKATVFLRAAFLDFVPRFGRREAIREVLAPGTIAETNPISARRDRPPCRNEPNFGGADRTQSPRPPAPSKANRPGWRGAEADVPAPSKAKLSLPRPGLGPVRLRGNFRKAVPSTPGGPSLWTVTDTPRGASTWRRRRWY
jgi:hypothetical protein